MDEAARTAIVIAVSIAVAAWFTMEPSTPLTTRLPTVVLSALAAFAGAFLMGR